MHRRVPGYGWMEVSNHKKLKLPSHFLSFLSKTNQNELCKKFLQELVLDPRRNLVLELGEQFCTMAVTNRKIKPIKTLKFFSFYLRLPSTLCDKEVQTV